MTADPLPLSPPSPGFLRTRPGLGRAPRLPEPGTRPLRIGAGRDALLYLPTSLRADRPAPLLVMLHGAGGTAGQALQTVRAAAEHHGVVVLAPESRDPGTWDIIRFGRYGPDVAFIDTALAATFARVSIDAERTAVAGFSDGASYAISLALANSALFRAALAFSPGFVAPAAAQDHPLVFISHGTRDTVLPVEPCGRFLAGSLAAAGHRVTYREFDGGHAVPPALVDEAFSLFLAG